MNAASAVTLGVLLCANVLVWRVRAGAPEAGFDSDSFVAACGEAFSPFELERVRFEDEGLLPEGYIYLEGVEEQPWMSVYAGYFGGGGLLREEPHDPAVCYVALGWEIVRLPEETRVGDRTVRRIVVERDGERVAAYYWAERPHAGGVWDQLVSGRTDLVWVRIELEGDVPSTPESAKALTRRIQRIARAASAALP